MGDPNKSTASGTVSASEGPTNSRTRRPGTSGRWTREDELASGSGIGRYVVLYRLGRGGMGVVYAAYDPQLDRKVAVKVLRKRSQPLKPNESQGRMLREAQALARLSHPNVVAVHDAGLLDGQVFVAMDFVEGDTLRRWLKTKPRTPREILSAYLQAGEALVAAHAAEIVHRDFKPDNALIGRDGRVQVLDFGLARLHSEVPELVSRELGTTPPMPSGSEGERRQGTPAYMAPEQHDRERVGPAADQYAFCVSLWEALCDRPPFGGRDDELVDNIKAGRIIEPGRGKLSGHLRRILRRGLSADPKDRYPTMRALLADLRRDPRRRWRRASLAGAAVALMGGGALVYAQLSSEPPPCGSAKQRLVEAWNDERRLSIDAAVSRAGRGHADHTREALPRAIDDYAERWSVAYTEACEATHLRHEQSEAQLDLRMACLGQRLEDLEAVTTLLADADADVVDRALATVDGLPAVERCADVVALRERQPLPRDPERLREIQLTRVRVSNSMALQRAGRLDDAVTSARAALRRAAELEYQPLVARAGLALGTALEAQGAYEEARDVLVDAEVAAEVGRDDTLLTDVRLQLVVVEGNRLSRTVSGHTWARLARASLERIGGDPLLEAHLENNIALVLELEARPEDVLAHQRRAIELAEEAGASELRLASFYNEIALTLAEVGRFEEALQRAQQARLTWERSLGAQHYRVAMAMSTLGYIHDERGDPREALEWYQRGYDQIVRELGSESPRTATILANLAISQAQLGRSELAEQSFRKVLALRLRELGPDDLEVARAHVNLGVLLSRSGQHEEALAEQRRALAIKERVLGQDNPRVATSLEEIANVLEKLDRDLEALPLRERALELHERAYGPEHPSLLTSVANLAHNRLLIGDLDQALRQADRALVMADDPSISPVERAFARLVLARVLSERSEDLARARELFDGAQEALTDHEAPAERTLIAELAERHGWEVVVRPPPSAQDATPPPK